MIAPRSAAEKPTEKTKGNITENKMDVPNTVNFTECLETYLRVQNFGGNFKDPYHRPYFRFSGLTVLENEDNSHKCLIQKKGDIFHFSFDLTGRGDIITTMRPSTIQTKQESPKEPVCVLGLTPAGFSFITR